MISVPPKILEAVGRHFCVADGVLDVFMTEIMLQGSCVVAVVCELEPTGVAKHVWVDREWHLGSLAEALDEAMETDGPDWPAALGNEYVSIFRVIASQLTKGSHLVTADWVHAGNPVLDAANVHAALG